VDLGKMMIQDWSELTVDGEAWKRIVEQASVKRRRKVLSSSLVTEPTI
jgi:hypothetical protein